MTTLTQQARVLQRKNEEMEAKEAENSEDQIENVIRNRVRVFEERETELTSALEETKESLVASRREVEMLWKQNAKKTEDLEALRKRSDLNLHIMRERLGKTELGKGGDAMTIRNQQEKIMQLEHGGSGVFA